MLRWGCSAAIKNLIANAIAPYFLHEDDLSAAANEVIRVQDMIRSKCRYSISMSDASQPMRWWSFSKDYALYNTQEEDPNYINYVCPVLQICIVPSNGDLLLPTCKLQHQVKK